MLFRAAFVLLPVVAFAQTPPPEVDEALRARVTEFFQYHVDANFRKAYELVAEDTKEQYFGAQKWQFKSFKIDSIKYSDNFTKAEVQVTGQRMWRPDQYSDGSLRRPTKNGRRETEAAQREPGSDRSRGAKYPAAVECGQNRADAGSG